MRFFLIFIFVYVELLFAGPHESFNIMKNNCDKLKMKSFCHITASCYLHGEGVAKDVKSALQYYKMTCNELKAEKACNDLGIIYELGFDVQKDLNIARDYYKKACKFGYDEACKSYKNIKDKLSKTVKTKRKVIKIKNKCDRNFGGTFLRYGYSYRFYETFTAGNRDVYMNNYYVYFDNPEYLDKGSNFRWTDDIKKRAYRIPAKESVTVYDSGKVKWRIVKHPLKRTNATVSSHDFVIKYKTIYDYSNTPNNKTDDKVRIDCKFYSVSWCGDGILDKSYEECEPLIDGKDKCDPSSCRYY